MTRTQLDDIPRAVDQATQVMSCTAEIAVAAYSVLLRSGIRGWWIDLELDIWRTLEEVAGKPVKWKASTSKDPHDEDAGSVAVVELLTDEVYGTALRHGLKRPFVDIELGLYRALQGVMSPCAQPGC